MVWLTSKGELILMMSQGKGSRVRYNVVCFGWKRHYRKDGTCKHTEAVLNGMRPWHRSRTTVTPFGDKGISG